MDLRAWQAVLIGSVVSAILLLSGCGPATPYKTIRLSDVEAASPLGTPGGSPLRVAVAPVISPKSTVASYSGLVDYLGLKMGRAVELVQRGTYSEINDLIRRGLVDVALVCSGAYVEGRQEFGMELVAAPQVKGETVYYSYLIVPTDSPVRSMSELRGKVFAYSDPLSNSGYFSPVHLLRTMGEQPDAFFQRTIFTYSHDNSVRAVADGLVDGAAVDSLVYEYLLAREPKLGDRLRIAFRSPPYAMPPVVVGPNVEQGMKNRLKAILLGMDQEEEGRRILAELMFDRFVLMEDAAYDSVRQTAAAAKK